MTLVQGRGGRPARRSSPYLPFSLHGEGGPDQAEQMAKWDKGVVSDAGTNGGFGYEGSSRIPADVRKRLMAPGRLAWDNRISTSCISADGRPGGLEPLIRLAEREVIHRRPGIPRCNEQPAVKSCQRSIAGHGRDRRRAHDHARR